MLYRRSKSVINSRINDLLKTGWSRMSNLPAIHSRGTVFICMSQTSRIRLDMMQPEFPATLGWALPLLPRNQSDSVSGCRLNNDRLQNEVLYSDTWIMSGTKKRPRVILRNTGLLLRRLPPSSTIRFISIFTIRTIPLMSIGILLLGVRRLIVY